MTTPHIISVGDLVVDLIFPVSLPVVAGKHQDGQGGIVEPGGGCNLMIMASRLGTQVSAIGAVGADVFGGALLDMLNAEGINTSEVQRPENSRTTLVLVLTDPQKHVHTFIGAYGEGDDAVYTDGVDRLVNSGNALLVQGYNLYERRVVGMMFEAMARAKQAQIPIFMDAGPTLHIVDGDAIMKALDYVDVLMMTEDEIPGVSGGRSGDHAIRYLLGKGAHTLVIKQGEQGCTVVQRDMKEHFPGFRVQVVDTVGAGDCFDAGYMTAILRGHDVREAAMMANAVGAAAAMKLGAGRNVPSRDDVNTILKGTRLAF